MVPTVLLENCLNICTSVKRLGITWVRSRWVLVSLEYKFLPAFVYSLCLQSGKKASASYCLRTGALWSNHTPCSVWWLQAGAQAMRSWMMMRERETKKDARETHTLVALLLYKGFSDLSCSRGILTQYLLCLSLLWLRHSGVHIRPLSVYKMNSILASWYHLTVAMVGDLKSTDIWPFPLKGQPLRCHRQRCFPLAHFFPSQLWHSYVDALR